MFHAVKLDGEYAGINAFIYRLEQRHVRGVCN